MFYFRYKRLEAKAAEVHLWLVHYNRARIPIRVVPDAPEDWVEFFNKFPLFRPILTQNEEDLPEGGVEITVKDFLCRCHAGLDDQMVLEWGDGVGLPPAESRIGRVFSVPVEGKPAGSTFEIPDFILHRHAQHSHFVQWGIGEGPPSSEWVFFSMNVSPRAWPGEYYENALIIGGAVGRTLQGINHQEFYLMNVNVNKAAGYGIIWHPKCACTTLVSLFGRFVGLDNNPKDRLGINHKMGRFRHNRYLEGIEYFEVVRNPYTRFLSTYIDKHVLQKSDPIYPIREEYHRYLACYPGENSLMSLCRYLSLGGYISDHFVPMVCPIDVAAEGSTVVKVRMEDGLNEEMVRFFGRWHPDLVDVIAGCFENTILGGGGGVSPGPDPALKYMNPEEWREYLKHRPICYEAMLDDELREMCRRHWASDFALHGYAAGWPANETDKN